MNFTNTGNFITNLRTAHGGTNFAQLIINSSTGLISLAGLPGGNQSLGAFSLGVSHSLSLTLNYATSEIAYSGDGGAASTFTFNDTLEFGSIDFVTASSTGTQAALDNIKIETVPEPATWVLLAGGGAFLMAFRRRRA